jgi:hypothetical protein
MAEDKKLDALVNSVRSKPTSHALVGILVVVLLFAAGGVAAYLLRDTSIACHTAQSWWARISIVLLPV